MPSLLSLLSSAERLAFPFVRRAIALSETATESLATFRAGGGHIRTSSWYDLYSATQELVTAGERLKFVNLDKRLDPSKMLPPVGEQMREFSFLVRVEGKAPRNEDQDAYYMTISSSVNLTRREIEEASMGILTKDYGEDVSTYKPVWIGATRRES